MKYHIAFNTDSPAPGWLSSVKVVISRDVTKDQKAVFKINLCDDPLYADLYRYCMANPPVVKK